jgi:hypothetical protein
VALAEGRANRIALTNQALATGESLCNARVRTAIAGSKGKAEVAVADPVSDRVLDSSREGSSKSAQDEQADLPLPAASNAYD